MGFSTFFDIAAHSQIAIADREQRLGPAKIGVVKLCLVQAPFIDGKTQPI